MIDMRRGSGFRAAAHSLAALVFGAAAIAGCGGSAQGGTARVLSPGAEGSAKTPSSASTASTVVTNVDTVEQAPATATTTTAMTTAAPQAAADRTDEHPRVSTNETPLHRHDVPPEGVERQVSFGASGDSYCVPRAHPEIIFDRRGFSSPTPGIDGGFPPIDELGDPEIGELFSLCMAGFAPNSPITVSVTDPTGKTQVKDVAPDPNVSNDTTIWRWAPRPGDPLGRYHVKAEQGSSTARNDFILHEPTARNIALLVSDALREQTTGDDVDLMLLGFEPDEAVRIDLYKSNRNGTYGYLTSITESAGPSGSRTISIPTSAEDAGDGWVARVMTANGGVLDAGFGFFEYR